MALARDQQHQNTELAISLVRRGPIGDINESTGHAGGIIVELQYVIQPCRGRQITATKMNGN